VCTLIVATQVWDDWPLVIAANRDEDVDRPWEAPSVREVLNMRLLSPVDLKAGGTWLGLNQAGIFSGITNRFGVPNDAGKKSRGALVFSALAAQEVTTAKANILALSAGDYNPFHLLIADTSGAAVIWSDGEQLHEEALGAGIHVLTERSFGAGESDRISHLTQKVEALASQRAPDRNAIEQVMRRHALLGFEGTCVHVPELNYATRSSTIIQLGQSKASVRFFFASGPPCVHPYQDLSHEAVRLLSKIV
jgi:uncharacterized protein with NRDE domain